MHIAVAPFPGGKAITGHDVHFHVAGQQVVTGMHAITEDLIYKKAAVDAFAHQTAIQIGEDRQYGVNIATAD